MRLSPQNLSLLLVLTVPAGAEPVVPEPHPLSRYEQLIADSPFAPATPVAAPVESAPFAANLYVSGLAKMGDKDFVTVVSRDQQSRYTLVTGEAPDNGLSLVGVQWDDEVGKSKVTIKKDGETAVLEFDQAVVKTAPAEGAPPPPMPPPAVPRIHGPGAPQPQFVPPGQKMPPGTQNPGQPRRRIRIINSKP